MSVDVTQILTRIDRAAPSNAVATAANAGDTVVFTLVTDSPVYAPGSSFYDSYYGLAPEPTLTLSNGTLAAYSGVDAQGRLQFSYKVGTSQDVANLTVTGFGAGGGIPLPKNIYFDQTQVIDTIADGATAAVGDANNDGRVDIVVSSSSGGTVLYLNDGDGSFTKATFPVPPFESTPFRESIVADLDRDGIDDVVRVENGDYLPPGAKFRVNYSVVEVLRGRGDGTFEDARQFKSDKNLTGLALADIDGDGRSDIVTTSAVNYETDSFQANLSFLPNASVFGQSQFDAASLGTATGAQTGIRVDTTAPVVGGVTAGGPGIVNGTGTLVTGQTATIFLNMSESVIVTNVGRLVLSLNDGGQATYDAAASTATQLVFRHTVAIDQGTSDLAVTGIVLNGAAIRDVAGNAAVLSGAVVNPDGTLKIDGFVGTAGNDVFQGRGGAETFRGLAGDDTYFVDTAQDVVIEAAGQGYDTVTTSVSYVLRAGEEIERLQVKPIPNGGGTGLHLTGNAFAQTIIGGNAADTLDGAAGADVLQGLGGDDTYLVDQAADRVVEAVGGGNDRVFSTVSYSLAAGQEIEALQLLAATGTAKLDLNGNEFGQVLVGNAGANTLNGGGGADLMVGNRGDDTYLVDQAADRVVEGVGGGYDRVFSTASYRLAAGQEIEAVQLLAATGTAKLDLSGNDFGQVLVGNAGANVLNGGGGADTMVGNKGDDIYVIDDGRDVVRESSGGGFDTIMSSVSYRIADGVEVEVARFLNATGQRNLDLTGNAFGQTLFGNAGANVLDGRGGADVLTGKAGQDAFVFSTALGAGNVDRITDFAPVDDTIRLLEDVFSTLDAGPLAASAFKKLDGGAKIDADDRILYRQSTGELFYDADGSGKAAGVKFAVIENHAKLTHDDFFVV